MWLVSTSALKLRWKRSSLPSVWGLIGMTVTDSNADRQQPHRQRRERMSKILAPRRAIIETDTLRQSVTAKRTGQVSFDRGAALIGASGQREIEARVIIEHRQWMATALRHREVALEVHLPERVGIRVFESLPRPRLGHRVLQQTVPTQDGSDRGGRRHGLRPLIAQPAGELARAPCGVCPTQRHHLGFDARRRTSRRYCRQRSDRCNQY